MKKIIMVIGLLVLVGCVTGLVLTYQALGKTEDTLQKTQDDVNSLQVELQDTKEDLAETQDELQETAATLTDTQNSLGEQLKETARYIDMYESTLAELEDTEEELVITTGLLDSAQQANEDLQEEIDEIQAKLDLYEDTLGTRVFSGETPPYSSGDATFLILKNNSNAKDPTYQELVAFLREDKTDKNLYVPGEYECGNFARDLHNNAEAAGIRAAFVAVHFYDEIPHAINAFKTADLGLVYIDVTGDTSPVSLANLDKKVQVAKDELYKPSLVFPQAGWYVSPGDTVKSIEIYW
jgi:hypothetical protein